MGIKKTFVAAVAATTCAALAGTPAMATTIDPSANTSIAAKTQTNQKAKATTKATRTTLKVAKNKSQTVLLTATVKSGKAAVPAGKVKFLHKYRNKWVKVDVRKTTNGNAEILFLGSRKQKMTVKAVYLKTSVTKNGTKTTYAQSTSKPVTFTFK